MRNLCLSALPLSLLALFCAAPAHSEPAVAGAGTPVPDAADQVQVLDGSPLFSAWTGFAARFGGRPGCKGARLSFFLARRGEPKPLFSYEAERSFLPASTLKVITAASVLEHVGPRDCFHTRLLWDGSDTLTLVGGGDPELTTANLQSLAGSAAAKLPSRIARIVVNTRFFSGGAYPPGWSWDDLSEDFAPEVRALTVDKGLLTRVAGRYSAPWMTSGLENRLVGDGPVQDGPVVLHNADLASGYALRWALAQKGVQVGSVERGAREPGSEVASWSSRPIYDILRHGLAVSDNQVMESMTRLCHSQRPRDLAKDTELCIVDGSGLSRYNLVTAHSLAQVMLDHPAVSELLPVPGGEGTLKSRFLNTPLQGQLHAKTGTMGGVSGLVGEFKTSSGSYVFALLSNGWTCPGRTVKDAEDEWLKTVWSLLEKP